MAVSLPVGYGETPTQEVFRPLCKQTADRTAREDENRADIFLEGRRQKHMLDRCRTKVAIIAKLTFLCLGPNILDLSAASFYGGSNILLSSKEKSFVSHRELYQPANHTRSLRWPFFNDLDCARLKLDSYKHVETSHLIFSHCRHFNASFLHTAIIGGV